MNKKTILLILVAALIFIGIWQIFFNKKQNLPSPQLIQTKEIKPSETLTQYSDPSGFIFQYPDNLSIKNSEEDDTNTYADLQLSSSGVSGSLLLRVTDSKFNTLDEWAALNKKAAKDTKEVSLGKLKGLEITTADRIYLGALDQGILFTIEMPLVEKEFWKTVYNKVTESFSFAAPAQADSAADVSFEGEEVIE